MDYYSLPTNGSQPDIRTLLDLFLYSRTTFYRSKDPDGNDMILAYLFLHKLTNQYQYFKIWIITNRIISYLLTNPLLWHVSNHHVLFHYSLVNIKYIVVQSVPTAVDHWRTHNNQLETEIPTTNIFNMKYLVFT